MVRLPNKSTRLHNQANFELLGTISATIFNICTLQILSTVSNQLSGTLPLYKSHQLANLKGLSLGCNSLIGNLPDSISNASKLERLDLIANNFSGIVPNSLGNLGLLERLRLGDNNFINEPSSPELSFITSLTNCKKLRVLSISRNPIAGTLPVSIGNLSASLQKFYAFKCRIKGTIPNEISNLSSLNTLSLVGNDLSGSIPNTIKGLQKLQGIGVQDNKLQGSIPIDLCQLPNLSGLDLSYNQLSGPVPACLSNISSLRNICLSFNKLTAGIPAGLGNLQDLLIFDASFNSVHGSLPSEIGNLKIRCQKSKRLPIEIDLQPVAEYRRITHQEILEATDGFDESNLLGNGSFGSVYKGVLSDRMIVVIKPTDEMFAGHMTLKCWVKESLPSAVIQVIDRNLLRQGGENSLAVVDCVSSILMLAVDCAAESPEQRINMKDVLATLKKIKEVIPIFKMRKAKDFSHFV
ncbi:hypothetical protein RJ640_023955 [Escallonia rubra]|uniref:Uncharacterized protein n=1 Tax=Escallonia rubra TaxID=112253 RepID=A0AA88R7R1_9ASTE|nr:hypothetical protein RJ640_023955 [Escallonia rubra]